jgi:hypothetical protein
MAGYHAFLSDWFQLCNPNDFGPDPGWVPGPPPIPPTAPLIPGPSNPNAVGGNGVDMRGWDAVAFLLPDAASTDGVVEMSDDREFDLNLVTPVIEVDYGRPIQTPGFAGVVGVTTDYPFWLEVWRPTKRFVRVAALAPFAPDPGTPNLPGPIPGLMAFLYRGTGLRPPTPAPWRAGGRAS